MNIHVVGSLKDCQELKQRYAHELSVLADYEQQLIAELGDQNSIQVEGYSWPLQAISQLLIDRRYSDGEHINWRERLVCKQTKFNNRIRSALHVFEQLAQPQKNDQIYITEQHTVLYQWLKKKYHHVQGSEYLTDSNGWNRFKFKMRLFPDRLIHQDLTALTFNDDSFKHVLSFDCFEHIPQYQLALQQLSRVIQPGGRLLFSVPFDLSAQNTLVRASVNQAGEIRHHVTPEYHGNPVSKQGSLSFYTFGWDLLDKIIEAGFKKSYGVMYWSKRYMYLGGPQLLLCAEN